MKRKTEMIQDHEHEANLFACYILMPTELFKMDMEDGVNLEDDTVITEMCSKYQVTQGQLLLRIKMYFKYESRKAYKI